MHSRLFFRWAFIVVMSLALSLFLAASPVSLIARARPDHKPAAITQGSLLALDEAGKATRLCPLKHTDVKAEISGFLSRVSVTQEFENPFKEKIEAVYTFPLPAMAAVDDMTMTVGERTVKGKIMRREQAQAVYEAAKNNGQVASLLDQERPNIFTQSVANIMPGERVRVTISYVETLKYEDGSYDAGVPLDSPNSSSHEIKLARVGLDYRLMTQFTSFVAVEDTIVTDGGEPRRVDVPTEAPAGASNTSTQVDTNGPVSASIGGVSEYVTISDTRGSNVDVTANTTGTNVERRIFQNFVPLNGRGFKALVLLAPGTAPTGTGRPGNPAQDQVSVNGQRPTSNSYIVDGVSANFGIAPGLNPGASAAGTMPGLTAAGGTNNLVSAEAIQELTLKTANFEAEFGRSTGGQFSVVTRSGTNEFHGSLFEFFGNDALDANDWFANNRGLAKPAHRLNIFGGTFGGPVRIDHIFFFAAYEGMRLRQPMVATTDVPSTGARLLAPVSLQPFLNAYPLPSGPARPDGFAEFAGSYANPARHDVGSLRLDYMLTERISLFGRYNYATSEATERGAGVFSLNTWESVRSTTQTLTGRAVYTISPAIIAELRGNYSRLSARSAYALDDFGGAVVPPDALLFPSFFTRQSGLTSFDLNGRNAAFALGSDVGNLQRQFNLAGDVTVVASHHTLKFGTDYRRLSPVIGVEPFEQSVLFNRVTRALTGTASRLNLFTRTGPQRPVFNNLSLYGQDEWRVTPRLYLNYGVRWEMNPAPSVADGQAAFAITTADDPVHLSLAPRGAALWKTTYGNFAPRASLSYQISTTSWRELVVHASFGLLYDLGSDEAGLAFGDSFPFLSGQTRFDVPFPNASTSTAPPLNLQPPVTVPLAAFDPHLKLPYTLQWSLGLQQALGSQQVVSAIYVGTAGRRLLRTETFLDPSPDFSFVRLTTNGAKSGYRSLQLQFVRRLSSGLQAMVAYTWSRATDNAAQDSLARTLLRSTDAQQERGPSDFDVRHVLSGAGSYLLPTPHLKGLSSALLRNWMIESVFNVRSARPVNVVYGVPTVYGFAYLRPDLLSGVPLYLDDPAAAGGRRLNPAAFSLPADERQGTLSRNSLRVFPLSQVDFAVGRTFKFTDSFNLQLKLEAFNLFNHPNFEDPVGTDTSLGSRLSAADVFLPNASFGESASMMGRSLWGGPGRSFSTLYQVGGPRTLQCSLKLQF